MIPFIILGLGTVFLIMGLFAIGWILTVGDPDSKDELT